MPRGMKNLEDNSMAESKQYITNSQEQGNVMISEDVIATIVAQGLSDVEGLGSMGTKPGITIGDFSARKFWDKGLKILIAEDNSLSIDCSIMVKYGAPLVEVGRNAQEAITSAIEAAAGAKVNEVNIHICGIVR